MDLSRNKRTHFDYNVLEKFEAGIVLSGHEVKSVKAGRLNLAGAFVIIKGNEAWLINAELPPYQAANTPEGYEPARTRKLLLSKKEIKTLIGKTKESGLTVVPLRAYLKNGKVKLEIGLARHKKARDKRETIRKRETDREINRAMKSKRGL
ncbi:MAG: SsrA-binding protein SmpB [Candidatus Colwellbacteria bacterium]|nr:SsrA-binding protein SmpB [Candidatus Colwellbacteria bacterium]